ncbi:hypothetical protein SAMN05421544_12715 [Riemerella columbipharyngis]|uniref:Uncharacterized protein n=1 Tax=Riemerella columbipharyngis TaxID=1071918 RepID=A0A1G7FTI1_9FLAO|nr:hypothetical protein SAMN05421544_12715 [Riemerella columbipharyngis]
MGLVLACSFTVAQELNVPNKAFKKLVLEKNMVDEKR